MTVSSQGTELPNIKLSSTDPTIAPGIPGIPNQLLIRTDTNQLYSYRGPLDTNWSPLGSPPSTPSTVAEHLEDFINGKDVNFLVDSGAGVGSITNLVGSRFVGTAQLLAGAIGDGVSVNSCQGFTRYLTIGQGKLTCEWVAVSEIPVLGTDFEVRLMLGTTNIQSLVALPACFGFQLGIAATGNNHWWAILDAVTKFDTGVVANLLPHKFTVIHDPTVGTVTWLIDSVIVKVFVGVPPANGLSGALCSTYKNVSAALGTVLLVDYQLFRYELTRP